MPTVGEGKLTPEERAMGLLFKLGHSLKSRDAVERGGATLVGTGTTFGPDGMTLNGNGNLSYAVSGAKISRSTLTIKLDLTFTDPAGGLCYIVDSLGNNITVHRRADNALWIMAGGTLVLNIAYATWSAQLIAGKNKLVVSLVSGSNTAWLNGTSIGTSATAWTLKPSSTVLSIGSSHSSTSRFVGTIHAVEIYGNVSTAVDEPYLRQGTLISKLDDYLVALPGKSYYQRDSDGLYVTEVKGKAGITEALMGSDGATAAQFPSIIKPRGFSFDGGDQINLGDDDRYSFTDGVSDKPFSVAMLAMTPDLAASRTFFSKTTGQTDGEWYCRYTTLGAIAFVLIDSVTLATISVTSANGVLRPGVPFVLIVTSRGNALSTGLSIYRNGISVGTITGGVGYLGNHNTALPVRLGLGVTGLSGAFSGNEVLPYIFDYEISPLQARALTARLKYQDRVA